jgi:methyltransferase family protein
MIFSKMLNRASLSPERIVIACVAENRAPFTTDVRYLFHSIAAFGGRLAQATRIAYFVGAADADIVTDLGQLGVIVKIVDQFDERYPHANKLRMFEDQEDYDVLVALDCDVVVTKDFSPILNRKAVMAKAVDADPLTMDQWKQLFRHFRLNIGHRRYPTTFHASKTIPYFNSGVVIVPKQFANPLFQLWKFMTLAMEEVYSQLPDIAVHRFFTDQFAFALALNKGSIPFKALPIEMNFPLHFPVHADFRPESMSPYVLHHHHRISNDGVMPCTFENINHAIASLNQVLTSPPSKNFANASKSPNPDFDNGSFWERRYKSDLTLGSGLGSRGASLRYKQNLLDKILNDISPGSVLDVGCGDIELTAKLHLSNYTGIDISKFVVERNSQRKPDWTFRAGDFLKIASKEDFEADLVLCLDVLIHEHDVTRYKQMVERLVALTRVVGVVGAYALPPRTGYSSDITAYHEPITETLKRAGAHAIQVIGYYRDTTVVCYRRSAVNG